MKYITGTVMENLLGFVIGDLYRQEVQFFGAESVLKRQFCGAFYPCHGGSDSASG